MAAPNLFAPISCIGSTVSVIPSTTGATDLLSNAAASAHCYRVVHVAVSNVDSAVHTLTLSLVRSVTQAGTYRSWGLAVPIVPGNAYVPIARDNPLFLEEGDKLQVTFSAANLGECIASYEDIS
jgi:hypothetical protein